MHENEGRLRVVEREEARGEASEASQGKEGAAPGSPGEGLPGGCWRWPGLEDAAYPVLLLLQLIAYPAEYRAAVRQHRYQCLAHVLD